MTKTSAKPWFPGVCHANRGSWVRIRSRTQCPRKEAVLKIRYGKRLTLHRDTLRHLDAGDLRRAEGALVQTPAKKEVGTSTLECTL